MKAQKDMVLKRKIRQNAWGNWYGYEACRKVVAFAETPYETQEQAARKWIGEKAISQ